MNQFVKSCKILAVALVLFLMFGLAGCNERSGKYDIVKAEYYIQRVSEFVAENEKLKGQEVDCVFVGDSWTDGYRYMGDINDTTSFYEVEYAGIKVLNRGIGGDNSYGLLQRLDTSIYTVNPKVVVILIGGNNMKDCDDDIKNIIINIKQNLPNTKIVMQSMYGTCNKDFLEKKSRMEEMNRYFQSLAQKYNLTYVDLYTHLTDKNGVGIEEYHSEDGVHMSRKGYEVITTYLKPVILDLLNS